jgi:glycolate oxidase FAD binding subunit
MTPLLSPGDETELAAIVGEAAAKGTPLAVEGGGTLNGLGRPMQTAATVSSARLTGITLYEPSEMVLSARAGTPLADVEDLLARNGQRLAFEPPGEGTIYRTAGTPTIGGVAAANLSGPRRIQAGAARDGLIGIRAVTGRGEVVKSGGRVMKNVTGLDLVKFLAGSWGTLAVLSEVTFKVLPAPETEATLILAGLDDVGAIAALSAALGSPYSVTGAAHIPAWNQEPARTAVRVEGFADSVAHRVGKLIADLALFGAAERLAAAESAAFWQSLRSLIALDAAPEAPIWRISVKPSDGPPVVERLRHAFDCRVLYDWGGGLVWIAGGEGVDAGAKTVRSAVGAVGGHATLVRASDEVRLAGEVFEPPAPSAMTLTRKLKESFDPAGILNPGRMYAGI